MVPLSRSCRQGKSLLSGNAVKELGEVQSKHSSLAAYAHHRGRACRRPVESVFGALDGTNRPFDHRAFQGADRPCRFRCARGEACEAAAALEGVLVLGLAPEAEILTLLTLLDRLCAMLTRLAHMGDRLSGTAQIGQRERSR